MNRNEITPYRRDKIMHTGENYTITSRKATRTRRTRMKYEISDINGCYDKYREMLAK